MIEVTETPWRYTTCLDLLDHWQTGLAGAGAVIAAFVTIAVTLRIERRQAKRELDALRKSLALELRLQITTAVDAYNGLRELSSTSDGKINARMVESKSLMPAPIIYSANAGKIGRLKDDAMDVVLIYAMLESARRRIDRLATHYTTPDDIPVDVVMGIAKVFLEACERARGVLPTLRTGNASYDAEDEPLTERINAALVTRRA